MNTKKPTLLLVLILGLFLIFPSGSLPAVSAQEAANFTLYLPEIITPPPPVYLPLIGKAYPSPTWIVPQWIGPFGGSIETLVSDPIQPNVFYAGTVGDGVYKSTDQGVSWIWSSKGLGNQWTDSMTIDPSVSTTLYAGTHGNGVYKTTDGGQNWTPTNNGMKSGAVVYSLAVNPGNHALIYAGTRDQGTEVDGVTHYQGTLYKSSNGGASWSAVLSTSDDWVYSIAADPSHPNVMLAAVHQTGPFVSNDYGSSGSWKLANIQGGEWTKGRVVAFDPRSWMNRAFYGTWHGDFYLSSNDGASWNYSSSSGLGGSHIFPNGMAIKPTSPDTLYIADHNSGPAGVMKSTNAGSSWSPAGLYGSTVYSVAVSSGNNNTVLAGLYLDGLYRSTDGGSTWAHSMTGLANPQVTGLAFSGSTILAGTLSSGVQLSSNGGATWTDFNNNIGDQSVNRLVGDPANPNMVFALTNSAGLRRIDLSSGTNWASVLSMPTLSGMAVGQPNRSPLVRKEPMDELSELEGEPLALTPQGQQSTLAANPSLLDLAFAPSDPNIAYLGSVGSGVYTSSNNGANWAQAGLSGATVRSLAVDPQNPKHVFALTNQAGVVKVSTDGAKNWSDIPLPGITANVVTVGMDMTSNGIQSNHISLYAGTNNGLWMYNGSQWTQVGLEGINVQQLAISPIHPYWVYAGTDVGAYVTMPAYHAQYLLTDTKGIAIQSISINPTLPDNVYFGTVYRGTILYHITP